MRHRRSSRPRFPRRAHRIAYLVAASALLASGACEAGNAGARRAAPAADDSGAHAGSYSVASARPTAAKRSSSTAESLVDSAMQAYYDGQPDSAEALLGDAQRRARQTKDTHADARTYIWLANVARMRGELSTARTLAARGLDSVLDGGFADLEPRAYSTLGFVAWYQNRFDEAARLFRRSLARARALGDREGVSRAANNLANIQLDWGQFDEARKGFETTLAAGRALGNPLHQAAALTNLGMLDTELGDPLSALPKLEQARRLYDANGYEEKEAYPLRQLGVADMELGRLGRARMDLDSALTIDRTYGATSEAPEELRQLGELYARVGDNDRALDYFSQAARIDSGAGGVLENATDLRSVAEIHAAVGDLAASAASAAEALRLHTEAGAKFEELQDRTDLAEVAALRGRPRDTSRHLAAARVLAREIDTRAARVQLALTEARIADAIDRPREVLEAVHRISSDLWQSGFRARWEAARLSARAYLRQGRLDSALASARRAVAMVEGVRSGLGSGILRTAFAASREDTYATLVEILLRLNRPGRAFVVADAARGQGMRQHLSLVGKGFPALDSVAASAVQAEELLHRVDRLVAALDSLDTTPPGQRDASFATTARDLMDRLSRARRAYSARTLYAAKEGTRSALLGTGSASVDQVRRALQPGEVLLEYLVSANHVVIFAVGREGVKVAESDAGERDLVSRVRVAVGLLRRPGGSTSRPATSVLERLYQLLVEPVARLGALAGANRLVIVPQGVLAYVPFAALQDPVTRRYVAQDFGTLYAPSGGSFAGLRLGKKVASPATSEVQAFAPFPVDLPGSLREVEALKKAVGAGVVIGPQASEAALRRALSRGGPVHVATYGVMNTRNPMFSHIDLSRGAGGAAGDGSLDVYEVLGMSIRAPLVFLSGCDTGLGAAWSTDLEPGEDYATLDRAFLYAGAGNVVATLWRVEDREAADFAATFYRELARTSDPVAALARAQRGFLASGGARASPFYWAAYRVSGVGR